MFGRQNNFRPITLEQLATVDRFELQVRCRAQVQPVYLGDYRALCRQLGRYKLYLDTRDRGFGSNMLLDGFWEMWLTIFFARHVRPGMVAFDIGANFGYYTLLLSDLVGSGGRVFAVEPNPNTSAMLEQSIILNNFMPRTKVIRAAAGEDEKPILLYSPHGEPKNAFVVAADYPRECAQGTVYDVAQTTIDLLAVEAGRVDFIKIDAEGSEEAIISGALTALLKYKPSMVVEFNAARCGDADRFLNQLQNIYGDFRYVGNDSGLKKVTEAQLKSEEIGKDWLLFFSGQSV